MTLSIPLALALFAPLILVGVALWRGGAAAGLPGAWGDWLSPALGRYLARRAALRPGVEHKIALALAGLLIAALAGPGVIRGGAADYANLAGRVLVVDASADIRPQQLFIEALAAASPGAPTALVAVAGDAYRLVPFTDDPAQIRRYLSALSPDLMPAPGRRLHLGLAEAEAILAEAGMLVGQIVLLSDQPPPEAAAPIGASANLREIAPLGPGDWAAAAAVYDARLSAAPAEIAARFDRAARAAIDARLPDARWELRPILLGLAALLWLALFRRRRT